MDIISAVKPQKNLLRKPAMTARDENTLRFYSEEAAAYTAQVHPHNARLESFLTRLPRGAKILELGCGAGHDSAQMIAAGFDVTPTDGTADIAAAAEKRLGCPVSVLLFEDIKMADAYDGIWANACLLHIPRDQLSTILEQIRQTLRPGGVFYASFKSGTAEGRDSFGRYFNYPDAEWLRRAYDAGWKAIDIEAAEGGGYDRKPTNWLHVTAVKG